MLAFITIHMKKTWIRYLLWCFLIALISPSSLLELFEVILAQCVVYMARAPKSVEVYKAYNNVKSCLRNHQGPLPAVPLHLRNAPTKLMKNLGYARGYKYNPGYSGPVEQEYLPEELRGVSFFTWTPPNRWLMCLSVWINKYAFYVKREDCSNNWFPFYLR